MITIVLYIDPQAGEEGRRLQHTVDKHFQPVARKICPDLSSLKQCLKRPALYGDLNLYVLLTDTKERLDQLHELSGYFEDRKVLLILPDGERLTFFSGFRIWPRYLTPKSESYHDVCQVLEKMIEYHNRE